MFKNRFKKFGGEYIPDIIEYLKDYIDKEPGVTIAIGCDSVQKWRKTIYAVTIMLYNTDLRNGAHIVFFRESFAKIKDNNERLYKEAQFMYDLGVYLDSELQSFYTRKDLSNIERKRYKYHLLKCSGQYSHVPLHQDESVINSLFLTSADMVDFRTVDVHLDFNPSEGQVNDNGVHKNKSYVAYKSYVPWLRGMGFRTFAKPISYASSSAADLLLQN
jgi:predicted RNase H-related nuclease YkuK (DUF458 family)